MRYGAVIVAAGMSTRMQQFKQLIKIGDMSFAERVVTNFQRAGVNDIVMVTGYEADKLESALKYLNIVFLRNEKYETTQMFDSVKIGLDYLKGKVDRLFFCPVDVPFFLSDSVKLEMMKSEQIVYPICHNRIGHPILFDGSLIDPILNYDGPRGLKGALDALSTQSTCYLPVQDEGTVMDADTKTDLQYLMEMQNSRMMRVKVAVCLTKHIDFFGPELRTLLKQIDRQNSVRKASDSIRISYSKAWNMIQRAEKELDCQLVERKAGGQNGGSAHLTEFGSLWIRQYDELERRVSAAADKEFCDLFSVNNVFSKSSREGKNNT